MSVTSDGAAPAPRRSGRIGDGASFLLETLRARPAARRTLSGVSVLLAVFAVGLLAYPMYTNLYQGRLQSKLATPQESEQARRIREALSIYRRSEDLINLGAYVSGSNPTLDAAIRVRPDLISFLCQDADASSPFQDTIQAMQAVAGAL